MVINCRRVRPELLQFIHSLRLLVDPRYMAVWVSSAVGLDTVANWERGSTVSTGSSRNTISLKMKIAGVWEGADASYSATKDINFMNIAVGGPKATPDISDCARASTSQAIPIGRVRSGLCGTLACTHVAIVVIHDILDLPYCQPVVNMLYRDALTFDFLIVVVF